MAAPINTPLNVDMWHLSIDDLLAPLPEVSRLGGSGPFVINLSVSTAPISLPATRIAGQQAHVYQIQRVEDGRTRYRLRLGPFADEDTANSILAVVREIYPSALTATAAADDLRAIAPMQAKLDAQRPPAVVAAMQPAAHPAASIQTAARPAAPISPAPMPPLRVPPTLTVSVPILTPPVHRFAHHPRNSCRHPLPYHRVARCRCNLRRHPLRNHRFVRCRRNPCQRPFRSRSSGSANPWPASRARKRFAY